MIYIVAVCFYLFGGLSVVFLAYCTNLYLKMKDRQDTDKKFDALLSEIERNEKEMDLNDEK